MPVLRDIVARLGIDLDKRGFAEADRRVKDTVKGLEKTPAAANAALASVGKFFGAAAIGMAGFKIVELASDANETLNLLDAAFGANSQAVQDWSADFAGAAGRSEFGMREMSGQLGAVLNPLMEKNQEVAAEMSTTFAGLAVDLGSFFNTADDQALNALRSGLTGEAEALKKFGVVMNDSTLSAFALSTGIKTNIKDMSIAEKTALRYEFILDQTQLAQGDAAKTSEGWANATKGLLTSLKDLGTRLGLTILPFAEKVVIVSRNAIRGFMEWQKGTQFLKAALIVLGAIGAKVALGLIIAWAPVIIPMLKFIAIVTIAALILDDFLTFMGRGDSVIGRFIDSIFGPGSASAAVDHLWEAWDKLNFLWTDTIVPTMMRVGASMAEAMEGARTAFSGFFADVGIWIDEAIEKFKTWIGMAKSAFKTVTGFGFDLGVSTAAGESANEFKARRRRSNAQQEGRVAAPAAAVLSSMPGQSMSVDNSVTVEVQGNATAADAGRIADASSAAQSRMTRRTQAALTQEGT